ncbi:CrcB-like protein-domain-containing protein [Ilyonectria robusta]|uniref:CrcB-like protein-domain-containing protein n=1 Tax=Ilyonectria robusta TaxID=1079257 RepID=UPI001E8CABD4|nr:CrcB-like protein-domain-containing protein [Ilyonectria robusta]KAH8669998.1 CrcB-like protein-domain-containing protein [Ilyonectria robusta]
MEDATDEPRGPDQSGVYDAPDSYRELREVSAEPPIQPTLRDEADRPTKKNPRQDSAARHEEPVFRDGITREEPAPEGSGKQGVNGLEVSRLATQVYTHSYLVLFAILGTLARLGLTALTKYPGTPVIFNTIWANFTGSLVMGFLAEDRMLFRHEWGTPIYHQAIERARQKARDEEAGSSSASSIIDLTAAKKAHLATKKTIPLYIGLATGFCGSFTTFSSFIKDVFLALSNELETPGVAGSPAGRNGGYSFMAMLAVLIATISLSLSGLFLGAQLALALERVIPSIPFSLSRKALDPLAVFIGWGCWLGAVLLCIFPPDNSWRGQATFALVFAPLGCLARFYLSLHLNGRIATFPMGTFVANVLGTVLLGMAWDIAHVPIGGVVGCQILEGVEDGFCGCLTTISTWVSELSGLRRRSAWVYGTVSVVVSLVLMIAIMGGLRWSDGYSELLCSP